MFGRDLLVAPVLREAVTDREVYLPAGDWYDYWTGRRVAGGRRFRIPVALDSIPIFVREGAFLFRQPVVQHTGEMEGKPLLVTVYPAARSEASFYDDDGASLDYRQGAFSRRRFVQRQEGARRIVEGGALEGSWRPSRDLVVRVRSDREPARVLVDRASLTRRSGPGAAGWDLSEDGFVEVVLKDRPEAFSIALE
jgi:alpha-glucosidase